MITQPYVNFIVPNAGGKLKPISNGTIYIGKEGLDPKLGGNPIYYRDNEGTEVEISNPLYLNMTGVIVDGPNSSKIITPYTKVPYSILINDKNGKEIWFQLEDVQNCIGDTYVRDHLIKAFSTVSDMLDNSTVVGALYSTGGTTWKRVSESTNTLADFVALTPANIRDWGVATDGSKDTSDAWTEACAHADEVYGYSEDTYLFIKPAQVSSNTRVSVKGRVEWNGIAPNFIDAGRDRGIFEARGSVGETIDSISIPETWEAGAERFPTNDIDLFDVVDYCTINAGSLPNASIGYLCKPSSDANVNNRVILDYNLAWDLDTPTFTYKKVTPVVNVIIEDFNYIDLTSGQTDAQDISGISFVYAVNCHARNVSGGNGTNPVVFTYYTADCTTQNVSCDDPQKVTGGKGYTVQWNNALRAYSQKMSGKKNRHVVDHTVAAYCIVEDSNGQNTESGDFITHGSYEHDITYSDIRGTLYIGASGSAFGESAKNIVVEKFTGDVIRCLSNTQNFTGRNIRTSYGVFNSVGLTLENVKLYDSPSNIGRFTVNNWSRQLGKPLPTKYTAVIKQSDIKSDPSNGVLLFAQDLGTDEILIQDNSNVTFASSDLSGGNVTISNSNLYGKNLVLLDNITSLILIDCHGHDFGCRSNPRSKKLDIRVLGGEYCCTTTAGQFMSNRDTSTQECKFVLDGVDLSDWTGDVVLETILGANQNWDTKIVNSDITQGSVTLRNQTPMRVLGNNFTGATVSLGTLNDSRISANNIGI